MPVKGLPVTEAAPGKGVAVTKVASGGMAVTYTSTTGAALADTDWPSISNRPAWDGANLTWIGPSGGGANNGTPVAQSRTLTASGDVTSTVPGQIIQGLNIAGVVRIRHNNVVLKQCRIIADGNNYAVECDSGAPTGVIVEDCILAGNSGLKTAFNPDGGGGGSIIRRCNMFRCYDNCVAIGENNMLIQDNWMHDLGRAIPDINDHVDGVQGSGGFTACTVRHNAIYSTDTSCVIMQNEFAGYSGLVIDNNLLVITSAAACIVCNGNFAGGPVTTISVTNNKLGNQTPGIGSYNDFRNVVGPVTYTGNTDYITGASIGIGQ